MSEPSEDELDRIALYALGVLDAGEAAEVEAVLARTPAARSEYDALRGAVDAVALSAEAPVDPARAARMRERILAQVSPRSARPAARRSPQWGWVLATAASVVLASVTVARDAGLRSTLAAAQRHAALLQAELAVVTAPDAKRFPVADGTVVVRGRRLYLVLRLPAPPRGKVYQAWTLAKGARSMTPSVTFTPDADGAAVVALPADADRVAKLAVSVEPDGGSRAPTSTPVFVRSVSLHTDDANEIPPA